MTTASVQFVPSMRRVERRALFTIKKCVKALKLEKVPIPVPVESWIEKPLGIQFGVGDLTRFGPGILGAVYIEDREIVVSDAIKLDSRIRFTAAHELGHIVLHSKLSAVFHDGPGGASPFLQKVEREADRFAAAFLIPLPVLSAFLVPVCAAASTTPREALDGLRSADTKSVALWRSEIVPRLADRFQVSRSAMANRFADLRTEDNEPVLPRSCLAALRIPGAGSVSWMTE